MTPSLDLRRLRDETPGTAHRIHLNNAGAALMPTPVVDAIRTHLALETSIGGYEARAEAEGAVTAAYADVASLLHTEPHRVAFTEHATASFQTALSSIPFRPGDVVLTTRHDYVSNQIQYLSLARRMGIEVVRAPDGPDGTVDLDAFRGLVHRRRPRLVAATHVPTNSGMVQDVAAIGRVCRDHDIWFLLDACQSLGQFDLDPHALGCDFLTATARKFLRGPRGAGLLWVSDRALDAGLEPLLPDLRGADWIDADLYQPAPDARRFETWEFAWGLVLGMGAAARYALDVGVDAGGARAAELATRLRGGLASIPGVTVLDRGARLCAIVTAHVAGVAPPVLVERLRRRGVNTSSLDRAAAVLDFDDAGVEGALRLSPHYYNTESEIDRALEILEETMGD